MNDFFTNLAGQPRDQIQTQVQDYLAANPREQAELQAIRQPLFDLENRCGTAQHRPQALGGRWVESRRQLPNAFFAGSADSGSTPG